MRGSQRISNLIAALLLSACSDNGSARPDARVDSGALPDSGGIGCDRVQQERASCQMAFPGHLAQSTVIAKGCYRAAQTPVLESGVTITLSPGVTILFAEDTGIEVAEGRGLIAVGTKQEPICLAGEQARRGFWRGLLLDSSASDKNQLDWVTVEHAGSTKNDAEGAAVKLTSDSRPVRLRISNTTLRESQGFGLWLTGSSELATFASNTLTRNTLGPASLDSAVVDRLDTASTYQGNDRDELVVRANRIAKAATWAAIGVPYYLTASLDVEAEWTLASGSTLIMPKQGQLTIAGDAAAFIAEGTPDKPILIRGEKAERGYWGAIVFSNTNNPKNLMKYVTVEHGGSGIGQDDVANVTLSSTGHGVSLKLSGCTLRESKGYGLSANHALASLPIFEKNTLAKNSKGPVEIDADAVHQLKPGSSYTGNDVDEVTVRGSNITKPVTWLDLGLPYAVHNPLKPSVVWKLDPGVRLIMQKDTYVFVGGDDAAMNAVGTADKPILITAAAKSPGFWQGLYFDNSNNGSNRFEHVVVEYGGGGQSAGNKGMIFTTSDSHGVTIHVSKCILRFSALCAIYLDGTPTYNPDIATANTFTGNAGDVCGGL